MDEGDSEKNNQKIRKQREQIDALSRYIIDAGNVFSTFWVRCTIQDYDGIDRFVLGCRRSVLFNFRLFLVIIYFAYEIFK